MATISAALLAAGQALAGLPAAPVEQWRWDGTAESRTNEGTCFVAQLTDDDGNGIVDERDVPDVVVPHYGPWPDFDPGMSILDGRDGALLGRITSPPQMLVNTTAVADFTGDGRPDIITANRDDLLVFRPDGSLAQSRPLPEPLSGAGMLSVADIDVDGRADVILGRSVLLGNGTSWVGTGGKGRYGSSGDFRSTALDLDPTSPGLEVLGGNTLYASDGSILWQAPVPDGVPAVADVDGDGAPDIVLLTDPDLVMLDEFGELQGRLADGFLPEELPVGPVLADIDGDGFPEIVVTTASAVEALEWTGGTFERSWSAPVRVESSRPGATAFDFDCDGAAEVVYRDEDRWYVFDGFDGAILHAEEFPSGTNYETPVVANLDGDPWAEIVVPSVDRRNVIVYEVPNSATPRPIFNQMQFHDTNVRDDGSVPSPEPPHWLTTNTFRAQVPADPDDPCPAPCPEPTLGEVTVTDPSDCNLGLTLSWEPVDFPSGSGTYAVYRSDASQGLACDDALSRPPVASGLTTTSWTDAATAGGVEVLHVVEAEDGAAAGGGCSPVGPTTGGTVARTCTAPTADVGLFPPPEGVGAVLRVERDEAAGEVVLSWRDVRPLLDGEHFHVLRSGAGVQGPFTRPAAEGLTALSWRELRDASPLVAYDVRIANGCEEESPDDFPPG